jgi:hypothetical protein
MRSTKNTWNEPPELKSLRELSARLGSDRLLVQASSGNISMKINECCGSLSSTEPQLIGCLIFGFWVRLHLIHGPPDLLT